jgi:hypothetical protein
MSGDTRIIQIILLGVVVAFTIMLTRSGAGARHQAIRRLGLLAFVAVAALSVVFPSAVTHVARWVGVGRGTDLVLYALVVIFFGYVIVTARGNNRRERSMTILARKIAIAEAAALQAHGTPRPTTPPPPTDAGGAGIGTPPDDDVPSGPHAPSA